MTVFRKKLEINDRFRHALQLMEHTDQCLFITGRAGTGKSTLLSHFCARTRKKPVVMFVLVAQARLKKRLDLLIQAERVASGLPARIAALWK
jgi:ABC-type lipoprotein export system ATPase subunit